MTSGTEFAPSDLDDRLCAAVWREDTDEVNSLLLLGADVNCYERGDANTPLHLAVEQRNLELVRLLLDAGADPEKRDGGGGWTPFVHAVEVASVTASETNQPADNRIARLLLDRGADVTQRTWLGSSALETARMYNNTEAEEMILTVLQRAADRT